MSQIKFPEFNLEFNIPKVAITIVDLEIYWYAVIIALGFSVSMIIYKLYDGKFEIKFNTILDLSIYLLPISLISARIYYILFNLNYYLSNPLQIFNTRSGGMAIYGGIIGGAITCYVFCKKRKINVLDLIDYAVPCLALAQAIGRIGNMINVESYGMETALPWRMGIYAGATYKEVHPTFLYELLVTFFIFIFLTIKKDKRKFKGEFACIYLIIYGFGRMLIEGLRIDSLMIGDFRVSQILSAILVSIFSVVYVYNRKNNVGAKR